MNFDLLLSAPGDQSGEMGTKEFLTLGQKRGNEHLVENITASEGITRRRLEADTIFTTKSLSNGTHLANHFPWSKTTSSSTRFTHLGFGLGSKATTEIPMLSRSAGILSLPTYSRTSRFAEMDAKASCNISKTKRFLYMHPSRYGAYTKPNEFKDSENNKQQMLSVYARNAESMRRALGKDLDKSAEDTTCQTMVNKFTLMGEPVDNTTEPVSLEGLKEMPIPASRFSTNPRGLYSSSPYFYNTGSFGSAYSNSTLSRGFYRSSNSSILLGRNIINDPTTNYHTSLGLEIGRHTAGSSPLLSFEATKTAMREAMRNSGKSPAEPETSKSVLKSVALRKKDRDGSNIFPANVKSLLSTGIFDGVSVKYVSWDRTKNVRGTIQGTGYLCWCQDCKKIKMVNAYQLEQHAGSKSKHPNDHIYFSNGKSIYGVVQELKSTPSDKLLEVIPTVTGSGINNDNFAKWKESYQAAGRELQMIFGSEPEQGEASSSKNAANIKE